MPAKDSKLRKSPHPQHKAQWHDLDLKWGHAAPHGFCLIGPARLHRPTPNTMPLCMREVKEAPPQQPEDGGPAVEREGPWYFRHPATGAVLEPYQQLVLFAAEVAKDTTAPPLPKWATRPDGQFMRNIQRRSEQSGIAVQWWLLAAPLLWPVHVLMPVVQAADAAGGSASKETVLQAARQAEQAGAGSPPPAAPPPPVPEHVAAVVAPGAPAAVAPAAVVAHVPPPPPNAQQPAAMLTLQQYSQYKTACIEYNFRPSTYVEVERRLRRSIHTVTVRRYHRPYCVHGKGYLRVRIGRAKAVGQGGKRRRQQDIASLTPVQRAADTSHHRVVCEYAHRLLLLLVAGPPPPRVGEPQATWVEGVPGLMNQPDWVKRDCMHLCDNARCINPMHLCWGTRSHNTKGISQYQTAFMNHYNANLAACGLRRADIAIVDQEA